LFRFIRIPIDDLVAVLRSFWRGAAARRVAKLGTAVVLGRVFTALGYILVARLYAPADFGLFAIYLAAAVVLTALAGASYDRAIVAETSQRSALGALLLALLLSAGLAVLLLLVFAIFDDVLLAARQLEDVPWMLWALPLGMFLKAGYRTVEQWAVRRGTFNMQGYAHVSAAITQMALQVSLAFAPIAGPYALLLADIGAGLVALGVIAVPQASSVLAVYRAHKHDLRLRYIAVRWMPTYALPSGMLALLVQSSPVLLLAPLFSAAIVGQVAMAVRILELPYQLIISVFSNVGYHRIASAPLAERTITFRRAARQLLVLAVAVYGTVAVSAPIVIPLLLGPQWTSAVLFLVELVPFYIGLFVTGPLLVFYVIARRENRLLMTRLCLLGSVPIAWAVQQFTGDIHLMLISFSASATLACIAVFFDMYVLAKLWQRLAEE